MSNFISLSRREFIAALPIACSALSIMPNRSISDTEPIIDIHQHTNYHGRSDVDLIAHQRGMGVTKTVLLPAGRETLRPSTNNGRSNGLAAHCGGNESCMAIVRRLPKEFVTCANEVSDLPEAVNEIERYLKMGAKGIAEQKFDVDCDSPEMQLIFELAERRGVPVLMHFQFDNYNRHIERFGEMLNKFPKVNFIGHAQSFWANIDKDWTEAKGLYPKGKVTPGGLTDEYLTHFPNMFADMSAGSGQNALTRDPDHAREFMHRHQIILRVIILPEAQRLIRALAGPGEHKRLRATHVYVGIERIQMNAHEQIRTGVMAGGYIQVDAPPLHIWNPATARPGRVTFGRAPVRAEM